MKSVYAFDLGGTYLRCARSTAPGHLDDVRKYRLEQDVADRTADYWTHLVQIMVDYVGSRRLDLGEAAQLVLAFPGPVSGRLRPLQAPTVVGGPVEPPNLHAALSAQTGCTVTLLNDVSAAACYYAAKVNVDRFIIVTVSSGIGSKLFDRQHPLGIIDNPAWAGEIGHTVVDFSNDAPICDCGGRGHLGAIASGRGIERHARQRAQTDHTMFMTSAVARHVGSANSITNEEHLVPAMLAGDAWALQILRQASQPLADTLRILTIGTGLEKILVVGGFAQALGPVYRQMLTEAIAAGSRYTVVDDVLANLVTIGAPEAQACLLGAAQYGWQRHPSPSS